MCSHSSKKDILHVRQPEGIPEVIIKPQYFSIRARSQLKQQKDSLANTLSQGDLQKVLAYSGIVVEQKKLGGLMHPKVKSQSSLNVLIEQKKQEEESLQKEMKIVKSN